jgi:hypothetical protein
VVALGRGALPLPAWVECVMVGGYGAVEGDGWVVMVAGVLRVDEVDGCMQEESRAMGTLLDGPFQNSPILNLHPSILHVHTSIHLLPARSPPTMPPPLTILWKPEPAYPLPTVCSKGCPLTSYCGVRGVGR